MSAFFEVVGIISSAAAIVLAFSVLFGVLEFGFYDSSDRDDDFDI